MARHSSGKTVRIRMGLNFVKKVILLMILLPMLMPIDRSGPLILLCYHCMQQLFPHHFEKDIVDDTLAYIVAREVIDILTPLS